MPDRSPYLTVAEAAELLRVHPQAVYRAIQNGEIAHVRVGRVIRIPRVAIDAITRTARAS